jgi:hypothetical protein
MIHIRWKGRFGNHLFQASCANFLSKKFNQPVSYKWDKILLQNECEHKIFDESIIVNNDNIEAVSQQSENHLNLILDDYFQNRYCIDNFSKYNTYKNNSEQLSNYTFVHIRLGDIKNIMSLDYEYYEEAINLLDNDKVLIASDSPDDEIVLKLKKRYNAEIFSSNEENTILMGANCKNKVLSLGTFSWWIGFLGDTFWRNQTNTVCPRVDRTIKWHGDIFPIFNWRQI